MEVTGRKRGLILASLARAWELDGSGSARHEGLLFESLA